MAGEAVKRRGYADTVPIYRENGVLLRPLRRPGLSGFEGATRDDKLSEGANDSSIISRIIS
jgi:hypothetical protein